MNSIMITLKINVTTNQKYYSQTLAVSINKEMFDFAKFSNKSKYYDDLNKLIIIKLKDETACDAVKEFVGLKPQICSFLVECSEHKKVKDVNKSVVAT